MKRLLLSPLFLLLLVTQAFSQLGNLTFDGENRTFIYHLPANYNPANQHPLVLSLHGAGSNGNQQEFYADFNAVSDTAGFVIVYPNGIGNTWNSGGNIPGQSTADDVGFINALIDQIMSDYSIDQKRVYVCGISNGGFMSYRLACELGHRFAAIASVAGQLTESVIPTCNAGRPMPVFHLHGTNDGLVDYNGEPGSYVSVDSTMNWFANNNICPGPPTVTNLPNTNTNDGSTIESYQWGGCQYGAEVLLYKILDGGHTWPGGSFDVPFIGPTNKDIHGSSEIWNFFRRFQLPDSLIGIGDQLFTETLQFGPNPVEDLLKIQGDFGPETQFSLIDIKGRELLSGESFREEYFQIHVEGQRTFSFSGLPPGLYFLRIQDGLKSATLKIRKQGL